MKQQKPQHILHFWFDELQPEQWWRKDAALDAQITERFSDVHTQANCGELWHWRADASGRLAEIIVLDQFFRNVYRNTPLAFAHDPMALVLAQEAVLAGVLHVLNPVHRGFLLLPYMHSESKQIHLVAESLYKAYAPAENYDFELRHKAIIDQFGRYPHRNEILGRASSAEELAFLQHPDSRF